ncbi:D-alanyl-D-alanine carboxypeptidase family protein [Magnetospirillum sulfuroxidans]|uniref:D-alanyl-D-alanine carboxypeptidase n=1 Tax=Magnetospirillum sulfuroxidans TaxID=611300 RepID=A0ABS5I925_9PROT|nr:D-alanyl-D-alanine carboxypeptidase family protein [Magnetospirillum sulfuroxidans]MBR9970929.1 D-alanyl-D-alanine carboxypeptidase [Magnetospirillum sulfuroxidans]
MRKLILALPVLLASAAAGAGEAPPPASIVIDAVSGAILQQSQAGQPRHPASLTKMMTVYLAFQAMAAGKADAATRITVSDKAASQGGSVLGLKAGSTIGLAEALKSLVVRSANDSAVAVAEHLAGSEAAFAQRMSEQAQRLGMNASHFLNATGLTAPGHLTTARDMAVLALALRRDFPQRWPLFASTSMHWGKANLPTVNGFVASYPGAEGLKTGFTCPAGYNLAAAATRNGHSAIAIVMGAAAKGQRLTLTSGLMNKAFTAPAGGNLLQLANDDRSPPDLSAQVCAGGTMPGDIASAARMPPGWAIEVAFGRDEAAVRRKLAQRQREVSPALGGGKPIVTIKPFDGVRYRGLIAGLKEDKAISVCLKLRQTDENNCLVLPPAAVAGAVEAERRWRMLSARE